MRGVTVILAVLVAAGTFGCASKKSSLLLERAAHGQMADTTMVARGLEGRLEPLTQSKTDKDVEISVTYASSDYLKDFFSNKEVFGPYAGKNPYYPEHLVFYLKAANKSSGRILIDLHDIVLVDDHGNQFSAIGLDYVTALGDSKTPVSNVTRGMIEDARPGYFGFSLPVGRMVTSKSQGPFALLKQSAFESGYLYPGVVHDGLVAFWAPNRSAKQIKLFVSKVRTEFNPDDTAKSAVDFIFDFTHVTPQAAQ